MCASPQQTITSPDLEGGGGLVRVRHLHVVMAPRELPTTMVPLSGAAIVLGRDAEGPNTLGLPDHECSRQHARVEHDPATDGTNTPYADIVVYYKNILKNSSNRELFRTPAMHQFDLGRYAEETMAYPPSVVVKDYTWNESQGYLVVSGTAEKRYKTVIQIVPR